MFIGFPYIDATLVFFGCAWDVEELKISCRLTLLSSIFFFCTLERIFPPHSAIMRFYPKRPTLDSFDNTDPELNGATESETEVEIIDDHDANEPAVLLTLSQMRDEVETAQDVSYPRVGGLTPSPSPSPFTNIVNSRSGWQETPPDCECSCDKQAYVVFHGRKNGIFSRWSLAKAQTKNFPNARFKGYHSVADAEHAYADALQNGLVGPVPDDWLNHHFTAQPHTPCRVVQRAGSVPSPSPVNPSSPLRENSIPPPYATPKPQKAVEGELEIKQEPITPVIPPGGTQRYSESVSPLAGLSRRAGNHRYPFITPSRISQPMCPQASQPTSVSGTAGNDDSWWVVCVGNDPGVYLGRAITFQYAGSSKKIEVYESGDGLDDANRLFVDLYASRRICRLEFHSIPGGQPKSFIPLTPTPNESGWYVVPHGSTPGVYEGRCTATRMAGDAYEAMVRCESERAAYSLFVQLYMSRRIV
ncbi:hypothetical protein AGABI2DRAFT_117339 [Agaricus bisporus var. bisporus H97]|uniref:hypothetical protein n=1 Tax=Agaricus bisporus var. bisporus (strain H97 / ATCC MYA-4626 / FGSC 10389) TaxID=936046 RepID=UPI00029F7EF8|nr:hypothetical protein AGABI2DRAFT_117339 [Agaricus bisporus var. bisporus H97]EKV48518.1 hypothetical protein AGABI2DRAFT_117339 [Agaricus bisporus var. bisporus H97]